MEDFENEYLLFRNDLILKYGEPLLKRGGYKSAGILMISAMFKCVPKNATFEEEISILQNVGDNINKPQIKEEWNNVQRSFRNNRYSEIVKDNKDDKFFKSPNNKSIDDKILDVETLGLITSRMLDTRITTGQTVGDLVIDLYKLYFYQYKLYRQNPQHPIFINAVFDSSFNEAASPEKQPPPQTSTGKGGCLSVLLFLILSAVTLILVL